MSQIETESALKALGKIINVDHKDIKSFIVKHQCDRTNNNFNLHEKKIMYLNRIKYFCKTLFMRLFSTKFKRS